MSTRQQRLASLSRKQFGLVSTNQLLNNGFTPSAIKEARRRGELAAGLPKVWRVSSAPRCWEQRPMGAVLSCEPAAIASHLTAAYLHELLPRRTGCVEITTDRCPRRRSGIIIHRCSLKASERVNVRGVPCTSVARTLVDLCGAQPEAVCEVALDAAIRIERSTLARLVDYAETLDDRSVRGRAMFRRLLGRRGDDEALSESEAESIFARLMRRGHLPIGERQSPRPGTRRGRIDFFYPDQNLVVEVDSRKFHSGRREKKRDKRYDNELNIGGKRVLRLTHEDLVHDEDYTLDIMARALGVTGDEGNHPGH